ncbi:helix-turn-helix transcriptional regulator [Bifidobacterium longum]|uniref:helix-turn-helix transcriptional regulator n=1 Tax=Bifidobacterium longum TaxID=216816 RepID=UPI00321A5C2C
MSGSGRTIPIGAAELRAIRERESVLEQTLARLTGVDTATVERIENGETPLSTLEPDQIRQWAKTLGVNPARLTGETPQEGEDGTTVIRRMRTERGWSCPQLAAHANVPYRSLRQYDSGERDTANMAAGILARVAIALDTSMEKLAGRPEPDHATDNPPAGWDGTRLAWHRTRQGLSQAELAIRAGQTTQTIGGIETRRWATGSKRSRIILDLAAGLGVRALDLMDQTPEGKPRMNDPKPAAGDDLVYRNHVNAAIDQLRLAARTADTGERIRLLTGALANTGNAIGQLAQFDSDGRARPPRK